MRNVMLALLATILLSAPAWAQDRAAQVAAKIDEYLSAAASADQFTGSVLVARDGKPIVSKGYGMANYELGVPNTPQTVFRLGGLTNQFTAMAIMMLHEGGKLTVSDPICQYLRECPPAWRPISIRHLLTHTSGLPTHTGAEYDATKSLPTPQASIIARFKDKPLEFAPGERYKFSSSAYYLLGVIIEHVSGGSYAAFVRDRITTPLAMTSTGYDSSRAIIKNRASGYARQGDAFVNADVVDMSVKFSVGGLYSTVEDLLRWDQALYTEKLVSRKSLDEMFTPFRGEYGYGWNRRTKFNRQVLELEGGLDGFNSFISRFPDDRVTVIVLSNSEARAVVAIANDLSAIVFDAPYQLPRERTLIHVPAATLDAYAGEYQMPTNVVTISHENGTLVWQAHGQPKVTLSAESETEFVERTNNVRVSFVKDPQGRVTGLVRRRGSNEAAAPRIR